MLCDVSYPRKLAFHYLQDLQKEFEKIDLELVNQITEPYSFRKFGNQPYNCGVWIEGRRFYPLKFPANLFHYTDNIICNIRRQYIDTRTQANLSKLNNHRQAELADVLIEQMSIVVERRREAGN
jgi:vesicle transport protein SEC22